MTTEEMCGLTEKQYRRVWAGMHLVACLKCGSEMQKVAEGDGVYYCPKCNNVMCAEGEPNR